MYEMLRNLTISIVCVLVVLVGCSVSESTGPVDSRDAAKTIRPSSGGEMFLISGGQFTMGDANGADDETPHDVRVDSFYMDKYPVSQELFEKVTGKTPSKRTGPSLPVERVQWIEAALFCNACSESEGLTPCYDPATWQCDFSADGYRLPTEAEWEYACRAGTQTAYFFGNNESKLSKHAWCKPHSKGKTWPVGEKLPNQWGLYDMHGNVWQWCNDYYSESYYAESPRDNPTGPEAGEKRVLRGGAWNSNADACRDAYRFSEFQVFTDACFGSDSYGFRRVRNSQPSTKKSAGNGEELFAAKTNDDEKKTESQESGDSSEVPKTTVDLNVESKGKIDPKRLTGIIAFVSDRGGALDIWKMKANGETVTQLTKDDYADADPRFSPSGDLIMYTSLRDGFPQIWKLKSDGTNAEKITDGSQAAWSPDGKSIVFIRDDQAYIRELDSGKERRVTPEKWRRCGVPAWRPDGKQIAVASRHLSEIGIFLLDTDGAKQDQLKTEDACCTPNWSLDGEHMLFQTDKGHIHLYYNSDNIEEQVTFGADIQHDARFSADGSMFVYSRAATEEGPWQLWITDLESDDLDAMQITNMGSNRLPDWHDSQE